MLVCVNAHKLMCIRYVRYERKTARGQMILIEFNSMSARHLNDQVRTVIDISSGFTLYTR
jgi:hypothetical protein